MSFGKFTFGIVAGSMLGMAASYAVLDHMRPDVTRKMMRNGKKVIGRYKRQMHMN